MFYKLSLLIKIDAGTNKSYTFTKVQSDITELAAGLQLKYNLKPKEKVAVFLPTCVEYPIITLAIQLCGGTAVLINPGQTIGILFDIFSKNLVIIYFFIRWN